MLDPICDMTVDPAQAAGKFDFDGETYFFCSVHCQKLFQGDPAKFLAAAKARQSGLPTTSAHQNHTHQLESKTDASGTIYTCPMHPEVVSDQPGKCPKCGMTLVLKK